jgi:hypothetical protein
VVHDACGLIRVPLWEIDRFEFAGLFCDLGEDFAVVVQGLFVVAEVVEPETGLKGELIEQEWSEIDIEVAAGVEGEL